MSRYQSSVGAADFHADTRAFFKGRRVLALGGAGFIGSHVVEQLIALDAHPVVLTRRAQAPFLAPSAERVEIIRGDLTEGDALARALKNTSVVLHMAAKVAGIAWNDAHPASMFEQNMALFTPALAASARANVERFLVTSSACVYPRHCIIPTPEEEGVRDAPEPTNAGYGWAKRMQEFLGQAAAKEYGLSVAIARPYNAYGPRDNFAPETSHVLAALIRKACETEDGRFEVWGDGSHSRSFLYVDDFARGLIEVAARYAEADPLNIGAEEETTIAEAAHLIARHASHLRGRTIEPYFNAAQLTGQPRRACDVRKARAKIGYEARVSLSDGVRATLEWYLDADRTDRPHT